MRENTPHGRQEASAERIFLVLFISVFSATLGLGIIVPLLPFYAESLGATGFWIGVIFSGFAFSRAVFMPLIGSLSDLRGRRRFMLGGLAMYTLLSVAYIAADSVVALSAVRVFHGLASAMVIPVAMAYAADFSPEGKEGRHMGTFMISLFLGMGLGPLLGGIIQDIAGMPAVFLSMAVCAGVALAVCILFLPESTGTNRPATSLRSTVANRTIRPVLFFRVANSFAGGTLLVFGPLLVAGTVLLPDGAITHQILSPTEIGIVISASMLATAFLQRPCGNLADRYDRTLLIVAGSVLLAAALLVLPFVSGFWPIFAAALLFGLGNAIAIAAATSLVTVAGRETGQGAAMGAYNTAMSVGMITAPLFFGALMDAAGIVAVFVVSGCIALATSAVFYRIARKAGIA
ncbi:MAG: MFS transporter [Methanomicrobiales archaeon]|nr:MFS transporter [Methanomicrobiales archaeon]